MINKTDLFIYCDWLIDNNINSNSLRAVIDHIDSSIVGVSRLGTDINGINDCYDDYGDGYGDGDGGDYGDGYGGGDGGGAEYVFMDDGDGFGDGYGAGYGYGYGGYDGDDDWDDSDYDLTRDQ